MVAPMAKHHTPSRSGAELARLLAEDPESDVAKAICAAVHRTALWRYTTGRRAPDADTIAKLHRLSGGRIDAAGWGRDAVAPTEAA